MPACFCGQVGSVQRLGTPHPRGWAGSGAASPRPNFHPTHPVSSKVCRPFSSRYEDPLKSAKKGRGSSHSETVDCKRGYTLRPEPYSPACPLESRCPTCLAEGAPCPMGHSHLALPSGNTRHRAAPRQGLGWQGFCSSAQVGPGGKQDKVPGGLSPCLNTGAPQTTRPRHSPYRSDQAGTDSGTCRLPGPGMEPHQGRDWAGRGGPHTRPLQSSGP